MWCGTDVDVGGYGINVERMRLEMRVCRGCGGCEENVVLDVGVFVDVMMIMMCCECGC